MFKKNFITVLCGLLLALMALPALVSAGVSSDRIWTEINDSALAAGAGTIFQAECLPNISN